METFENFDLKRISWVKIGGRAKKYIEVKNSSDFINIVQRLRLDNESFEVLGWGANTLISDSGLDCTVLKCGSSQIEILGTVKVEQKQNSFNINKRSQVDQDYNINKGDKHGYTYDDLNYLEPEAEDILVKVDAGVSLPYAINYFIDKGITGLEMFTGIPGTIGGSVFNNIHGGPRLFSEFIFSINIIDKNGEYLRLKSEELEFDYNKTPFQKNEDSIVSVVLALKFGNKERARWASVEWAKRKATQPKNSLGSVFHNLTEEERTKYNLPSLSAGYIIDHILKLGGYRVGNIMIPEEANKNIFLNLGDGKASDYLSIMKKVYKEAYERLGIKLKSEIYLKGFDIKEVEQFI